MGIAIVQAEHLKHHIADFVVRRIHIDGADSGALARPINGVVALCVNFLPQLMRDGCNLSSEVAPVAGRGREGGGVEPKQAAKEAKKASSRLVTAVSKESTMQ